MLYNLFDYVDFKGNSIKKWTLSLLRSDQIKFRQKLDMLKIAGSDLPPKLLSRTNSAHIMKLRFIGKGKVQLRPMLCKGPIDNDKEFTLLLGAQEKGFKLDPPNADHEAEKLRQQVIADPKARRCVHERVS